MQRINNTKSTKRKIPISFWSFYSGHVPMCLIVIYDYATLIGMQEGWRYTSTQGSMSKPVLLALITALVIGVVAPLVIPHATHPSMIYHILLHIAGLTIAIFLSIVSFLAYSRNTTTRLLLMAIGFTTLALVEFFYLLQADGISAVGQIIIPAVNIELSHVILLLMVSLFGLGVLKVSK
jgi:hypothetical protein